MKNDADDAASADLLMREALAWVARLTSGTATRDDADALLVWRQRSAAHDDAFRSAARLWRQAGVAADAPDPGLIAQRRRVMMPTLSRRGFMAATALAACAAGITVAGVQLGYLPAPRALLADHRTDTGEQKRLVLADGSIVDVNTRTSLKVAFSASQRRLDLIEGEAAVAVAADTSRPFVVAAADGTTTATGTQFAVRRLGGAVRVVCLEGTVSVRKGATARLSAGDQATYDDEGIFSVARVDAAAATAWRQGMLIFRDQTLDHVVDELNRYRRGWIWISRNDAARRRVTGVFHLSRPDEALAHVERTLGLTAMRMPAGLVLLR